MQLIQIDGNNFCDCGLMEEEGQRYDLSRKVLEESPEAEDILKQNEVVLVYRCRMGDKCYVVKRINRYRCKKNADQQQHFCKKLINQKYVVRIYDVWKTDHFLFICMDYYQSDMKKFILENWKLIEQNPSIPLVLFLQYLFALTHLRVMHRDIKPENSFVQEVNGEYKLYLSDFGQCNNGQLYAKSYVGTTKYQAPQINSRLTGLFYGRKADVWSLGITLFQLFNGKKKNNERQSQEDEDLRFPYGDKPFIVVRSGAEEEEEDQMEIIEECVPYSIPLPKKMPVFISRLIRGMLEKMPQSRYSFKMIYEILLQNKENMEEILGEESQKWMHEISEYYEQEKENIEFYKSQQILLKSVEELYSKFYRNIREFSLAKRYHKLLKILYFGVDQILKDYTLLKEQFHLHEEILATLIPEIEFKSIKVLQWDLLAKLGYIEPKSKTEECRCTSTLKEFWQSGRTQQQLHQGLKPEKISQVQQVFFKYVLNRIPA